MRDIVSIKTSRGDFWVRPYREGDESFILPAWEKAFGKKFPRELWEWKYPQSPYGFLAVLCFSPTGDLAVYYGGQRNLIWHRGGIFQALHLADIFTHPAYRWAIGGKRSLFCIVARIFWKTYIRNCPFEDVPSLGGEELKQIDLVWGIPGERHFRLGKLLVEYEPLPGGAFYAEIPGGFGPKGCLPVELIPLREELPFDAHVLWCKYRSFYCGPLKEQNFWSWRYLKHPYYQYWVLILYKRWSHHPQAFLCLKEDEKYVTVMDLLAADSLSLWDLLKVLPSFFPGKILRVWTARLSPFRKLFLAAGWQERREPLQIVPAMRGFIEEVSFIANNFQWMMGDADLF